jgi:hypothetical protein
MSGEPVPAQAKNLFQYLGERMISKIEDAPIEVVFRFADGTRTVQIEKRHPWHKELSRRRAENLCQSLRRSLGGKGGFIK